MKSYKQTMWEFIQANVPKEQAERIMNTSKIWWCIEIENSDGIWENYSGEIEDISRTKNLIGYYRKSYPQNKFRVLELKIIKSETILDI